MIDNKENNNNENEIKDSNTNNDVENEEKELKSDNNDGESNNDENNENIESKEETSEDDFNEKLKEANDKYIRLLAEFDNFRKRSEKENKEMCDIGASVVLAKMLPIVDNFERALNTIKDDIKENSFEDGVDKIYKQLLKTLDELEVKKIDALGKKFDPNIHNAVMTDDKADAEVDTVTEELQKGYTYKGNVLRHSMVKVKK